MPKKSLGSRAQRHHLYSRNDLRSLFDISESTLTNWINAGLEPIDKHRPQIFAGHDVKKFLNLKNSGKRKPIIDGRVFCFECSFYRAAKIDQSSIRPTAITKHQLRVVCTTCDTPIATIATGRELVEIGELSSKSAGNLPTVYDRQFPRGFGGSRQLNTVETNKKNQRLLYGYLTFLRESEGLQPETIDSHLSHLAKVSALTGHKDFGDYTIDDAIEAKRHLRTPDQTTGEQLSRATIGGILNHATTFFNWLSRRADHEIDPDLPGYFRLSRVERKTITNASKVTVWKFSEIMRIFKLMPRNTYLDIRNRAVIALCIMTAIRVSALRTLRGKHVDVDNWWIYQDPKEVKTKGLKYIRTYCLNLSEDLREAVIEYTTLRKDLGFGDEDAWLLPSHCFGSNNLGIKIPRKPGIAIEPLSSESTINQIFDQATEHAGHTEHNLRCHDFSRSILPYLEAQGDIKVAEKTALELNLGHSAQTTIHQYYNDMLPTDRKTALDALCDRLLGIDSISLALAFERGELSEAHPNYKRAKEIHQNACARYQGVKIMS